MQYNKEINKTEYKMHSSYCFMTKSDKKMTKSTEKNVEL